MESVEVESEVEAVSDEGFLHPSDSGSAASSDLALQFVQYARLFRNDNSSENIFPEREVPTCHSLTLASGVDDESVGSSSDAEAAMASDNAAPLSFF